MKKVLLIMIVAASGTISLQAQKLKNHQPNFGFMTGVNVSNLRAGGDNSYDWKGGLVAGLYFTLKAGNKFSIQPEALYSSMGGANSGTTEGSLRLNYFSIPVLAKFALKKNFYVVAGPQIDVLISAKNRTSLGEANTFSEVTNNYKEDSYNGTAGIEFWPTHCLGLTARYIYGFNSVNRFGTTDYKNQAVQLTLGVKL